MLRYFAYGSNMDEDDFNKWCENHGKEKRFKDIFKNIHPAKLDKYKLRFNYYSQSRYGGAANIMVLENNCVYGLLMDLEDKDIEVISEKEGENSYDKIPVPVTILSNGTQISSVTTYKVKTNKEEKVDCPPTVEYLYLIIRNAIKYKFPLEYIEYLNLLQTKH
jgi:hypothetical protein